MIVEDVDIEIRKFKMFAENADSEAKIMELCKKYLKHKGVDVDKGFSDYFKPQEPQKIYVGMKDIISVNAQTRVDDWDMSIRKTSNGIMYARKYIVDEITHQLVQNDMILFETYKDMPASQTIIHGKLNVWKEPNVK